MISRYNFLFERICSMLTSTAPSIQNESPDSGAIANILHATSSMERDRIYISSADRRWTELSASAPYNVVTSSQLNDNPILSSAALPALTALTTMSGQLLLLDNATGKVVSTRRDHTKYAIQIAVAKLSGTTWVLATASWDGTIKLYRVAVSDDSNGVTSTILQGEESVPTIKFQSNPESILFVRHPDTDELYLVASRRDSTHLYYYKISTSANDGNLEAVEAGRQNLAPHSNAWVSFTPSISNRRRDFTSTTYEAHCRAITLPWVERASSTRRYSSLTGSNRACSTG
jgi:WD40 repeat protein